MKEKLMMDITKVDHASETGGFSAGNNKKTEQNRAKNALKKKRLCFVWGMLALPILQFLVFNVYVNIGTVKMSFQHVSYATGTIERFTFQNYKRFFYELFRFSEIAGAMKNSLYAGLNNALILLPLSLIFGYLFYKKVPGTPVFRVIFFIPSIISIVVYTMVYKYMFNSSFGPVNALLRSFGVAEENMPLWLGSKKFAMPLVLLYADWVGIGYELLILGGAIAKIPEDVMEYAKIDGVGMFKELFVLIVPMIWPTFSIMLLGCITVMFTFFIQVQLLTEGGPDGSTVTIAYMINSKIKGVGANLEWASCLGLCFTLIAIPLIVVAKKLLAKVSNAFGY